MRTPRLLQRRWDGTLALLIGATCLLMLLAAAAALALNGAARTLRAESGTRLVVQVVEPDAGRRERIAGIVEARLVRLRPALQVHRVGVEQAAALIAPYVAGMTTTELPIPAMIDVRGGDAATVTSVLRTLPSVEVTPAGAELGPVLRLLQAMHGLALGVALVAAAAAGLIAVLAARTALAREAATLGTLHALGATDGQAGRLLTGAIARDAAGGAAAGGLLALLLIGAMAHHLAALDLGMQVRLGVPGWTTLLLLPLLLAALATAVAQLTLAALLRRAL